MVPRSFHCIVGEPRLCFDPVVQHFIAIGLGGFAGALCRYAGVRWVHSWTGDGFPWGTFVVNVAGSFLLGLVLAVASVRAVDPDLRAAVAVGFCGSLTTMSSFSFETLSLLERGAYVLAAGNVLLSVGVCVASVWCGLVVGRAW